MEMCVCGSTCEGCKAYPSPCGGCNQLKGRIFWARELLGRDTCSIFECVVETKHLPDCGHCGEVPCRLFYEIKDPASTEEEHLAGNAVRLQRLRDSRRDES